MNVPIEIGDLVEVSAPEPNTKMSIRQSDWSGTVTGGPFSGGFWQVTAFGEDRGWTIPDTELVGAERITVYEQTDTLLGVVTPKETADDNENIPFTIEEFNWPPRVQALQEAIYLINGERDEEYGTPQENFGRIRALFDVIVPKEKPWTLEEVCLVNIALKLARAVKGYKRDTIVDLAGYAGIMVELMEGENGPDSSS